MKYKVIFIVVSVILMIGIVIYIALDKENKLYKIFPKDGYILTSSKSTNSSIKYYFNAGSKYKAKYPSNIVFTDIDNKEIISDDTGIVHYSDKSISVLKKSVIIDTDDLDTETLKYYNIFDETILENNNGNYTINNAGKKIIIDNFIIKVSDNKYLLVSNDLKLFYENEEKKVSGYLELNIIDGDIIKLENQEVSFQTISSKSYIMLGEKVKLDLSNNKVLYNGIEKFTLNQLVIDSNDNIPIEKDEIIIENVDNDGNSQINVGKEETEYNETDGNEEEIEIEELPTFYLVNMQTTSNKIDATVKITDDNSLLIGNIVTKIIESSSGKTVYFKEDSSGSFSVDVMVENLSPNTSYVLIINSDYKKNGITFNRDFLIKNFRTENLGISIKKNYFTKSELSFIVNTESYSKVKTAEVVLIDSKDQIIKTFSINATESKGEKGTEILFGGLTPNTFYKVKIYNFLYDGVIISNGYEIEYECKTLKNKPVFGTTSFLIDKKNSLFTLRVNNVSDVDNGIESYKYKIFDVRTLIDEEVSPVSIIEKSRLGSIDLPIDQVSIFRGVPYTYKLVAEFYDNEKYIEYESEYSDVFKMDGVEFPTVRFEPTNVTFEKIEGTIIITDAGNTISLDNNLITISYSNSTGSTKSFTTGGNLSIPLSINNLRSNETYTISIYTSVNLQDGNQTIDNCFVGSVVVKTAQTKNLLAKFNVDTENVTAAFAVNTILGAQEGVDNKLEADVLTGISFNLYSGQNTSGTLVRSIKKIDRNLLPYSSELKDNYYDKSFLITPDFFGAANNDMQEEFYTLEIVNAFDYTEYKNNIPVSNQTITVKSNGFVPNLPPNLNNAIEVNVIRNRDAGDKYRADLLSDTIVGYRIKGSYDNSRNYAKYLKYYVFNASTNTILDPAGTIVNVNEDGVINYVEYYLGDGTDYSINDVDLRRGNEYYFTYEAFLDLNYDGTAETIFPFQEEGGEPIVLKSNVISPRKQEPIFKIYPSTSSNYSMTLKYMFSDIDNALISDRLYSRINGSEVGNSTIQEGMAQYSSTTLLDLTRGYLRVETEQALIKNASSISRKNLINQYFDSIFSMKTLNFHVIMDVNRLIISILDYDANVNYINRIAALKVTFTSGETTIVKDNLALENDSVIIDLAELSSLINKNVVTSVQAYYDTGITGFETPGTFYALQTILNDGIGGEYLSINNLNNFRGDIVANGSIYNMTFAPNSIALNNLNSGNTKTIQTICDQSGIIYNYEYLLAKKLEISSLVGDGTEYVFFNTIIPGVSLLNIDGRLNVSSTLRTAQFRLKFYGVNASQVLDNKFYVELYETDESGTVSTFISETPININGIDNIVDITNLIPKTQYFIKLYANIYNGTEFVRSQLYDLDFKTNTKSYYFSTLSTVGISNVAVRFLASTYNDKVVRITYNLDTIVGYDKIKYELFKYIADENGIERKVLVDEEITYDVIFNRSMIKNIASPPGSDFTFGQKYNLIITPIAYVTINGVQTEIEIDNKIDYDFYLDTLRSPFIGIVGSATEDFGIEFKISISDIHKVIVNGIYTLRILDELNNDITPIEYKNVEYSITTLNNTIILNNIERAKEYRIIITTYQDKKNNMLDIEKQEITYSKFSLDDSGIDIGNLYSSMNSLTKSKIDLLFYNSYKLTYITEIRYSIYNFNGYAQDNMVSFIPTQMNSPAGTYYLFSLLETLPAQGLYNIEIQFLFEGRVIAERSLEHNYILN